MGSSAENGELVTITLEKLGPGYYGGFAGLGDDSPDDLSSMLSDLNAGTVFGADAAGSVSASETSGATIQTYIDANGNLIVPGGVNGNLTDGYTSISPSGAQTSVSNTSLPSAAQNVSNTVGTATQAAQLAATYPAGSAMQAQYLALANALASSTGQTRPAGTSAQSGMSSTVLIVGAVALFGLMLVAVNR